MSDEKKDTPGVVGPADEAGAASGVSPVEQDAGEDITTDDDGTPVDNPGG